MIKDIASQTSGAYLRTAILLTLETCQHNLPHWQNKLEKPHGCLSKCRKNICPNSTSIHEKKQQLGIEGSVFTCTLSACKVIVRLQCSWRRLVSLSLSSKSRSLSSLIRLSLSCPLQAYTLSLSAVSFVPYHSSSMAFFRSCRQCFHCSPPNVLAR